MLPGPLVSVYQQYKTDTNFVASWLATTARVCGYPAGLLSNPGHAEPKPKSSRLKGKARTDGAKNKPTTKTTSSKYPKSTKPRVRVPDVFSTIISRVIDLRTTFGGRMEKHGVEHDPIKDKDHQFFVGVLEAVRDTLRPLMSTNTAEAAAGAAQDARKDQPSNIFDFLSVYEPSQAFLDAPAVSQPQAQSKDDIIYEAEPQTSADDIFFAFVLLMDDLNKIRARIRHLWLCHRDGTCDLAVAAVATNTAVEFARGLIDEMMPLLKNAEDGTWGLTFMYTITLCVARGLDQDSAYKQLHTRMPTSKTYEIVQDSYVIAYMLLRALPPALHPDVLDPRGIILVHEEGEFGFYDPTSDRGSKTGQQKFQEDETVIREVFVEFMAVIRGARLMPALADYPATDEFMRAMEEIEKTLQVPFYGVFAAQVFLDIHHTLRASIHKSFAFMTKQIDHMATSLDQHLEFHKNLNHKTDNWPASYDQRISDTAKYMRSIISSDRLYNLKVAVAARPQNQGTEIAPASQYRLLKYSPVISGLILFRLRAEMHDISIDVINAWGSIAYPAHLYNALQKEMLLSPGRQWLDMDAVLALLGDSNIWVGEGQNHRPNTVPGYLNRTILLQGLSVAASLFADPSKQRHKFNMKSRAGPRFIKEDVSLVSAMFRYRYYHRPKSGTVDWTPEHVEDILARSAFDIKGNTIELIDDPAKLREKRAKANAQRRPKNRSRPARQSTRLTALPGEYHRPS